MIKEARGYGNTIDEAKEKAIAELNASDDEEVQFEVVSTPKKKTLGLFGGCKAEVRVYVEIPDEKPKKSLKKQNKNIETKNPINKNNNKPSVTKTEDKNKEIEKAPKVIDNKQPAEEKKEIKTDNSYGPFKDASDISEDSQPGKAIKYLKGIFANLGCSDISIKVAEKENGAMIDLDGEGLGVIIGHRGETLDSLQYLTSLATNNGGGYYKVSLNIGNYREKREETLISLAKKVSQQVLKTGKNRSLEPMNPYERRIIHTTVQDIEGVVSNSFGEGASRRVVIAVEGSDIRPPRRENTNRRPNYSRPGRQQRTETSVKTPTREPKKDNDTPLYGKIN